MKIVRDGAARSRQPTGSFRTRPCGLMAALARRVVPCLAIVTPAGAQLLPRLGAPPATAGEATAAPVRLSAEGPWRCLDGRVVVGVRFEIAPKWHTYWLNPGDSGLAPRFTPTLPEGWSLLETRFPRPEVFRTNDETTIGYEDHAVILLVMSPESNARGGRATIATGYLVCKEICIAGEGEVAIELPNADAIPSLPPLPSIVAGRSYPRPLGSIGATVLVEGETIRISGRWAKAPGAGEDLAPLSPVRFIPFDILGFSLPEGLVTEGRTDAEGFQIAVTASFQPNDAPPQGLRAGGLVTLGAGRADPCFDFTVQVADDSGSG